MTPDSKTRDQALVMGFSQDIADLLGKGYAVMRRRKQTIAKLKKVRDALAQIAGKN